MPILLYRVTTMEDLIAASDIPLAERCCKMNFTQQNAFKCVLIY